MLVFFRPGLRWDPLRLLPREPCFEKFAAFVLANASGVAIRVAPINKINARKLERIVFMH